jgi:hypothetical protein
LQSIVQQKFNRNLGAIWSSRFEFSLCQIDWQEAKKRNGELRKASIVKRSGVNESTWWHDRRLTLLGSVEPTFFAKPTIHNRNDGPVIGPAFA